jgi:hypothetical protein
MNSGVVVITKPMFPGTKIMVLGVHDLMIILGHVASSCHFYHVRFPLVEHSVDIHSGTGASWLEHSPSIVKAGAMLHASLFLVIALFLSLFITFADIFTSEC